MTKEKKSYDEEFKKTIVNLYELHQQEKLLTMMK